MAKTTAAGTTLSVAPAGATPADGDYVLVAEITDYGDFGREYQEIKHNPVNDRKTYKFKGSYDEGSIQLQLARDISDDGQALLVAALDSDKDYYFRVELPDAVTPSTGHGTYFEFVGKVMSFKTRLGQVNNLVGATCTVSISGAITTTSAT